MRGRQAFTTYEAHSRRDCPGLQGHPSVRSVRSVRSDRAHPISDQSVRLHPWSRTHTRIKAFRAFSLPFGYAWKEYISRNKPRRSTRLKRSTTTLTQDGTAWRAALCPLLTPQDPLCLVSLASGRGALQFGLGFVRTTGTTFGCPQVPAETSLTEPQRGGEGLSPTVGGALPTRARVREILSWESDRAEGTESGATMPKPKRARMRGLCSSSSYVEGLQSVQSHRVSTRVSTMCV